MSSRTRPWKMGEKWRSEAEEKKEAKRRKRETADEDTPGAPGPGEPGYELYMLIQRSRPRPACANAVLRTFDRLQAARRA